MKKTIIVEKNSSLTDAILKVEPQLNYSIIKTLLRKKDIRINNKKISSMQNVNKDDVIELFLPNKKKKNIDVIYEDDNILIANKQAGMEVTTYDKSFDKSNCMEEILNFKACHRLDKNTEGLVVFAKNNLAENEILNAFKNHNIFKKYLVITYGKIQKIQDNLIAYLLKDSKNNLVKIFDTQVENSVKILTNYKVLKNENNLSLLEVELLTGKTHQIRAHLAHIGLKVLGDDKYGDKKINREYKVKKQCLCAYSLKFNFDKASKLYYLNNKSFKVNSSFKFEDILKKKLD